MFQRDDTIAAIATPHGRGGLGIVRVSGPDAVRIALALTSSKPLEPRRASFRTVRGAGDVVDHAVVTRFPEGASYTGEETVEFSIHASQILLRAVVQAAVAEGARLAEPGEFTFRAFLNGRIDLVQAEAVRDLVEAVTPLQARAAYDQLDGTLTARIREIDAGLLDLSARLEASLDFPEEGYHFVSAEGTAAEIRALAARLDTLLADASRGRLVREGAPVAIIGRPNTGKSSLFNRLAGADRAIVTEVPGTTRDLVTERVDIEGILVTLVDTAGLRDATADAIEREGMQRSRLAHAAAALTVVVLDGSAPLTSEDRIVLASTASAPRLIVENKSDLPSAGIDPGAPALRTSARTGEGIGQLRAGIARALTSGSAVERDVPAITNVRHITLLERAHAALIRGAGAAAGGAPEEIVAVDVADARTSLEEVTGARTPDDVLREIFERFCIGK
jgi:tRNA modification GTPase